LVGADPPAAYELLWRRESPLGDLLLLRLR
jgi:hypothetical protein